MKEPCSLIISTYNWPEALELCLRSVMGQTILPDEILVADDGSGCDTHQLVEQFSRHSPIPIVHVWQPDEGFRLARIRNQAIARASNPYIIQIDGDLILHRYFIEDHLHLQQGGYFVSGSRVMLNEATTCSLLAHGSLNIGQHHRGSKNFLNRLRNSLLRSWLAKRYKTSGRNKYYIKGCNMAYWRKDMLKVNGYNEAFTGWGLEDSELAIRLINAGFRKKFLKMGGITYHLHHAPACRKQEGRNKVLMEEAILRKKTFAGQGVTQHLRVNSP